MAKKGQKFAKYDNTFIKKEYLLQDCLKKIIFLYIQLKLGKENL